MMAIPWPVTGAVPVAGMKVAATEYPIASNNATTATTGTVTDAIPCVRLKVAVT